MHAEHLCELHGIEIHRRRGARRWWDGGRFGLTEGLMYGRRERDRPSATANVEVHDVRRFVDKMIVERRLLDAAALQGVDHRSHFGLHQDQVAH